jgi:SAM-dependent methyltransferase
MRSPRGTPLAHPSGVSELYKHPKEYDLEHSGDDEDLSFYLALAHTLRPKRVLELGCGTGRITLPLARIGSEQGFDVVGLDSQPEMLDRAQQQYEHLPPDVRARIKFIREDMRTWKADSKFDLVIVPCGTISHLLSLDEQIQLWKTAHANLVKGGRLLVEVVMPNLAAFADSFQNPPRTPVEVDIDTLDKAAGTRLIRRKTTQYDSAEQCAQIRFMYEKYRDGRGVDSYIDDFTSHVFFPRELSLLFVHTGFEVESITGDYHGRPLRADSRLIIMTGVRST